ncbi:MAG TPA: hypothetical protein DCQ32_09960 [Cyanobacteria bacterium UBA8156]|jgi:hypothetical protein|nr:hypothetical protein [Cyanobacteria bacterium UBA8156]
MMRSKVRSRSAKHRSESGAAPPRPKARRVKPPRKSAIRRPDVYSWVLIALMLFAGTASGTIAYSYGRRALNVVREIPAGNRSFRSRRNSSPPPDRPAPVNPPQDSAGEQSTGEPNPEEAPTPN